MTNSSYEQTPSSINAIPVQAESTNAEKIKNLESKIERLQKAEEAYENLIKVEISHSRRMSVEALREEVRVQRVGYSTEIDRLKNESKQSEYIEEEQPWYVRDFPRYQHVPYSDLPKGIEIDVAVITTRESGFKAVLSRLAPPYPQRDKVLQVYYGAETYYVGKLGAQIAVLTWCHAESTDQSSAALAVQQAKQVWKPKAIIMTGVALGKDPIVNKPGDVLIASQIIHCKSQPNSMESNHLRAQSTPLLVNRFENAYDWQFVRPDGTQCTIKCGPILSYGLMQDKEKALIENWLSADFPEAIGAETTGSISGLVTAASKGNIAWILVSAVYDWAVEGELRKHELLAAASAASLIYHILAQDTSLHGL